MAKVRKKKTLQETIEGTKKPFVPGITPSTVNPMLGSLAGLNAGMQPTGMEPEGMKQQMDSIEMKNQGAPTSAPMPAKKVRKKKDNSKLGEQEPLSPQTWANIGNNPSAYPEYLAAWKKKFGKK